MSGPGGDACGRAGSLVPVCQPFPAPLSTAGPQPLLERAVAERTLCLSVVTLFGGDHNHPDIPRFLSEFGFALYAGEGKKPKFLLAMGVDTDFPLRMMVGVPARSLDRQQRLLAETAVSVVLDRDLGDTRKLWSSGAGWRPVNPGRIPGPARTARLDFDWMLSLGVPKTVWERDVLHGPALVEGTGNQAAVTMRQILALGAFGFADPYQFFTADLAPGTIK